MFIVSSIILDLGKNRGFEQQQNMASKYMSWIKVEVMYPLTRFLKSSPIKSATYVKCWSPPFYIFHQFYFPFGIRCCLKLLFVSGKCFCRPPCLLPNMMMESNILLFVRVYYSYGIIYLSWSKHTINRVFYLWRLFLVIYFLYFSFIYCYLRV